MDHLTRKQAKATERYIQEVARRMNLGHWNIYLAAEPAPDDCWASVWPTDGKASAPVAVCREWPALSPEAQRESIVHELIHVVHRDQTDIIRLSLHDSGYLPQKAYRLLFSAFRSATEVMVDHIANVIAPTMPLPEVPSE